MIPVLLALALCASWQPPSEPEGVLPIRERYTEVKGRLGDGDGLYRTEIVLNAGYASFPALGNYQERITFYWWSEGGTNGLVLAVRSGEYAAHAEYEELLWDEEGALQFRFFSWDNATGERNEVRRWYAYGSEIHATACTVTESGTEFRPPAEDDLIYEPEYFEELFELLH